MDGRNASNACTGSSSVRSGEDPAHALCHLTMRSGRGCLPERLIRSYNSRAVFCLDQAQKRTISMPAHSRRATIPLLMTLLLALVAGCAYHPGGDALAFLRNGALYTIQPDGANLHQIANGSIVSYGWSPSRQQLAYRTASPFPSNRGQSPLENTPDLSGNLSVVSVNGGSTLPISPDAAALVRSDAWWNADGNRLLYAERFPTTDGLD